MRLLRRAGRRGADAVLSIPGLWRPFVALMSYDTLNRGKLGRVCLDKGFLPVPVHFYQPIPDVQDLSDREVWSRTSGLAGVDFRSAEQIELLTALGAEFGGECDWPVRPTDDNRDFYTDNDGFSYGCAASTYMMTRYLRPRLVIEIGSGNSSRVIAQALQANGEGEHVIIDPYPGEAVSSGLSRTTTLIRSRVELQDPSFFDQLDVGDILLIDSGHTVRIGGDVNYEFLEVLPRLKRGVAVHVHDILLPYEYPMVYAQGGRKYFWTEQYLLQAFLAFNREFEVLLAMHYLERDHNPEFCAALPLYDPAVHRLASSSFWIRRKV